MKTDTPDVTVCYVTTELMRELENKLSYTHKVLLDGPYATVSIGGILHPNPECPATWPSEDMIPQRGEMIGVSLSVLVAPTTCAYCAGFYQDRGAGARWMMQQLAPALATHDMLKGVGRAGYNLSRIVETRLLRQATISELLRMVSCPRDPSLRGGVWLVRRSEASSLERHMVLEGSLSHYADGTSIVVTTDDCARWGLMLSAHFCASDAAAASVGGRAERNGHAIHRTAH
jgi:hypothetical protein